MLCKELYEQLRRIPNWVWEYYINNGGKLPANWNPYSIVRKDKE